MENPKKKELIKNLECSEEYGDEIMRALRDLAHDGRTVSDGLSIIVSNIAATRMIQKTGVANALNN